MTRSVTDASGHVSLGLWSRVLRLWSRAIGLQPTSPRITQAFPVRKNYKSTYTVHAAPFCQHHGIKINATHRFINPEFAGEGLLVLKLSETVIVSRIRDKKK